MALAEQAEANTEARPETLVADRKYGTSENCVAAQQAGYRTHLADPAADASAGSVELVPRRSLARPSGLTGGLTGGLVSGFPAQQR